jgi:hypothetical protein
MVICFLEMAGALVISFEVHKLNLVFGMTEVKSRVCLISTARHDPDFPNNV